MDFSDPNLLAILEAAEAADFDTASFGIVAMDRDGVVVAYNSAEAKAAGLSPARVVGQNFFTAVAPCTNNFMVAQRFADEPQLDATIDYVFTLKMRPTKVQLRMLGAPSSSRQYLLVRRS